MSPAVNIGGLLHEVLADPDLRAWMAAVDQLRELAPDLASWRALPKARRGPRPRSIHAADQVLLRIEALEAKMRADAEVRETAGQRGIAAQRMADWDRNQVEFVRRIRIALDSPKRAEREVRLALAGMSPTARRRLLLEGPEIVLELLTFFAQMPTRARTSTKEKRLRNLGLPSPKLPSGE